MERDANSSQVASPGRRLRRCVVDRRCILPEGFTAGFDLEQDRKRFYVSERGITLITPEMLGQKVYITR